MDKKPFEEVKADREKIAKEYCIKKGWTTNIYELTIEQIIEIRSLPEWQKANSYQ